MYRTLIIIISLSSAASSVRSQDILSLPSKDMTLVHAKISGGNPVAGVRIYLSVPGKNFEFKSAVSDSSGNVDFLLQHSGNERELVLQANAADSRKYTIEPGNPLTTVLPAKLPAQNTLNTSDTLPFYGSGDKTYLLDDYVRFATLEEILIEYVHEVKLKKLKGDYHFEVLNTPYNQFFIEAPLVLIDGVPVFDLNKFMSLNPLAIRKLEVVARKYYLGSLVCYGIVSFTSYDGGLAGYGLPSTALVLEHRQAAK